MSKRRAQRLFSYLRLPVVAVMLFMSLASESFAMEISAVNVKVANGEIFVTTEAKPDLKLINDMNEGLSKEFIFYIDLFRVWSIWPDEFITGKKIIKVLRGNQIKREYVGTRIYENIHLEKRFKDPDSMVEWSMNNADVKLANIKELEPGSYFVKVTVESRIRKLPPVIGHFIWPFVPDKEFSVSKNSPSFTLNTKGSP